MYLLKLVLDKMNGIFFSRRYNLQSMDKADLGTVITHPTAVRHAAAVVNRVRAIFVELSFAELSRKLHSIIQLLNVRVAF